MTAMRPFGSWATSTARTQPTRFIRCGQAQPATSTSAVFNTRTKSPTMNFASYMWDLAETVDTIPVLDDLAVSLQPAHRFAAHVVTGHAVPDRRDRTLYPVREPPEPAVFGVAEVPALYNRQTQCVEPFGQQRPVHVLVRLLRTHHRRHLRY